MIPQKNEKVVLTYSTSKLTKTLAITKITTTHCYEWSIYNKSNKRQDGSERIAFFCAVLPTASLQKAKGHSIAFIIRKKKNEMLWDGTSNGAEHACAGPKEIVEVKGREIKRSFRSLQSI